MSYIQVCWEALDKDAPLNPALLLNFHIQLDERDLGSLPRELNPLQVSPLPPAHRHGLVSNP